MSPRSVVLWLGLLVGVPTAAAAQAQTDIDPVAVSPDKFTVLLENVGESEVRVLLVEVKAAEGGTSTVPANKR